MSDFDQKDIQEDVTAQASASSDFDPADIHVEKKSHEDKGALDAFQKGTEQGATLGSADEAQGAIGGYMDMRNKLLDKLGLLDTYKKIDPSANDSITDVNAKLKADGFTGDIGPTDTTDLYRETRDAARQEYDEAQKAHPWMYFGGNLVGGVGGAMAAGALAPEAASQLFNPLGPAEEGAGYITRMGQSAANAMPSGAVAGLGTSNADLTKGEIGQAAADSANGMKTAMAIGAAMPPVIDTAKATFDVLKSAKALLPDSIKTAFKRGTKGVNVADENLPEQVYNQKSETAKEMSVPLAEQQSAATAKEQELNSWFKSQLLNAQASLEGGTQQIEGEAQKAVKLEKLNLIKENKNVRDQLANELKVTTQQLDAEIGRQIDTTKTELKGIVGDTKAKMMSDHAEKVSQAEAQQDQLAKQMAEKQAALDQHIDTSKAQTQKQLMDIEKDVTKSLELQKQAQVETNASNLQTLQKKIVDQAKKLQTKLGSTEQKLGNEFRLIENETKDLDIRTNSSDVVKNMNDAIQSNVNLSDAEKKSLSDAVNRFDGDLSYDQFLGLKKSLYNMFGSKEGSIRGAAKIAYKNLVDNFAGSIEQAGRPDLATKMRDTNLRYSALKSLEGDFVDNLRPDPHTKQMYAADPTLRTINNMAGSDPTKLAHNEQFADKLKLVDPNEAPALLDETSQLANQMQAAKDFKPSIPSKDEALAQNPEVAKLQQMLNDYKSGKPSDTNLSQEISDLSQQAEVAKDNLMQIRASKPGTADVQNQAKQVDRYQELLKTLKALKLAKANGMPDSPEIQSLYEKAQGLQQQIENSKMQVKEGIANVPGKTERLYQNPEYTQKKAMLDTVRSMRSVPEDETTLEGAKDILKKTLGDDVVSQLEQKLSETNNETDPLLTTLPKNASKMQDSLQKMITGYGRGDGNNDEKVRQLVKIISQGKGPDYEQSLLQKIKNISDDSLISSNMSKRSTLAANTAGRMARVVTEPAEMMSKGVKYLSGMDKNSTVALAGKLRTMGPIAQGFANVLESSVDKSQISKDAIIFGLMQRKEFRDYMYKLMPNVESENH